MQIALFPLARSGEALVQPGAAKVRASIRYLEDTQKRRWKTRIIEHLRLLLSTPINYLRVLMYILLHAELDKGYHANNRFVNFALAVSLAVMLRQDEQTSGKVTTRLHAHFAHDPTLIAYLVHRLTGIPFSFTAHARDLYQVPVRTIVERCRRANQVVTCCKANRDYLLQILPVGQHSKVHLIHHGVDLNGLHPVISEDQLPPIPLILSVGRLVEKKGFSSLIQALAELKQAGVRFTCQIYGDGPLRDELAALIVRLGLTSQVVLAGEYTENQVLNIFSQASIFVLTPVMPPDGDRDGIPNVLVEAMACGIPVVSTAVAGILELVQHGRNGFLADPDDIPAIRGAMQVLLLDRGLRNQMGQAARQTVLAGFNRQVSAQMLAAMFGHIPVHPAGGMNGSSQEGARAFHI